MPLGRIEHSPVGLDPAKENVGYFPIQPMLLDGSSENEEENVDSEQSDSGEDDDASNDSDTSDEDDDDTATGGDKSGSENDDDEKEASGKKTPGSPRLANRFRELTGNLKAKDEENALLMKKMEQMQSEMETLKRGGKVQDDNDDEEIDISSLTSDPKELARIQEFMKLQDKARKLSKNKDATPSQIKSIMDEIKNLKTASETFQKQSAQQADQAALKKVIGEYADVIDADELEARVYNQIYEWEHSSDPREKVLAQAPWKKIVKLVLDEDELDEREAEKIKAKKKKTAKKIDTDKDSEEKPAPASEKRERWNPGDPIGSREAMMARMREKLRAAKENE